MRKILSILLFFGFAFLLTACNEVEERLNSITISFETNNDMRLHSLSYQRGESISLPQLQSVGGSLFRGWFLDESLTIPVSNLENREESFTLYAKWEVEHYDILVDVYNKVPIKGVYMNEIAIFVLDDLGTLYIQTSNDNPLYSADVDLRINPLHKGLIDPNDGDFLIVTWGMNAFIVHPNGTIYAWGDNTYGQLGTGDKVSSVALTDITDQFDLQGDESIIKIVGNEKTTFALTTLGNLFAWGANTYNMIGEKEITERLTPTNIKDELCGQTDHFLVNNGLCGNTGHLITDIIVTDTNVMVLTSYHQVFLWGLDAHHWFDEIELTSENISEAVYMYFEGHVKHMVASSNTVVLISELDEILILGTSKLGTGTDHAWGGGPLKMSMRDYLDVDDDGDGVPTIYEAYLVANTLILHLSNDTLWGLGDNSSNLVSHKKGYDYYRSLTEIVINFVPVSIAMSSQEVCALDTDPTLWCWGTSSSKSLGQNNEMILSTEYKHVEYQGENTNWEGVLENENTLRAAVGPIKWMAPESRVAAPFSQPHELYTLTRHHISAIPLLVAGIEVTPSSIVKSLCATRSNDCDDSNSHVHPEAWDIYTISAGVIRWTFEIGIDRARAGTPTATYSGE